MIIAIYVLESLIVNTSMSSLLTYDLYMIIFVELEEDGATKYSVCFERKEKEYQVD